MRRLDELPLSDADRGAILEADRRLRERFPVTQLLLFGSVARGQSDKDSDIDLLALTAEPPTHDMRHAIYEEIFEINLEYGTLLSIVCIEQASWNHGRHSLIPLREEIRRDGVLV